MHIIDRAFLKQPRHYITQSVLAALTVAVILYFVEILTNAAIVAALGASTFIVFAMPQSVTASPRRLIGGHVVGVACGAFCYFVILKLLLGDLAVEREWISWFVYALSVGLSIFLMTITNTEHPPAAATALGLVSHVWLWQTVVFILACAIGLAIIKRLCEKYLRDLF